MIFLRWNRNPCDININFSDMKKILFVFVGVFAALQLSAQQPNISNPGFEQWSSNHPTGWTTSISGSLTDVPFNGVSFPLSLNFATQTSDAHSGSYALKLQAKSLDLSSFGGPTIKVPGVAQLGTAGSFSISSTTIQQLLSIDSTTDVSSLIQNLDMDELSSLTNIFSKGEPFNMVPTAMKAWVKYLPPAGEMDTMLVLIGAYKEGETSLMLLGDMPDTYGYFSLAERVENYTEITVPLEYNEEDLNCDSLVIVFMSSSFMNANTSTELFIDDISFEFDYMSVESAERVKMQLYPNPAVNVITLSVENQLEMYSASVYDMNGKQLKRMDQLVGNTNIPVGDLSAGTYFLKVQQTGNTTVRKFVVE